MKADRLVATYMKLDFFFVYSYASLHVTWYGFNILGLLQGLDAYYSHDFRLDPVDGVRI
jgi:hypothetical protein